MKVKIFPVFYFRGCAMLERKVKHIFFSSILLILKVQNFHC